MRPDQLSRIDAAFDKGIWGTLAGDHVTFVDGSGKQHPNILCMVYNLKIEHKPGLIVDEAGLREQETIEIMFSKKILVAAGLFPLDVAGYWIIDGIRFDFAEAMEVLDKQNPVGGLHNLVVVRVRQAAELNQTVAGVTPGPAWGYDL